MADALYRFESIVRRAGRHTEARSQPIGGTHPFDERDIHPGLPSVVRDLFDDGHYAQATFEAFKFIDKQVQRHSKLVESGFKLMMQAFAEASPAVQLTPLATAWTTCPSHPCYCGGWMRVGSNVRPNNSMQRTALRAAADAER